MLPPRERTVSRSRIRQIVRRFPENGMKLLLENPANVRDLLNIASTDLAGLIDFDRMKRIQTTFVARDYRHVESDVVLVAPRRVRKGSRSRKKLVIYILIEHQSEPDRLMPLRMLDYSVQVFKYQVRQWSRTHGSLARIRLEPILPVVFYTGTRRWDSLGSLTGLMEAAEGFAEMTPAMEPLFLNLPATKPDKLESEGGYFGHVLRLVQQRKSRPREFNRLLQRATDHLETIPAEERMRWLEFLSYILALVYHGREPSERSDLHEIVEASVRTGEHRQEFFEMSKTIADVLKEEGAAEGEIRALRRNLIQLLEARFDGLPTEVIKTINATRDIAQLEQWLKRCITAASLEEMGIGQN